MNFIQENLVRIDLGLSKEYSLIQFNDVHVVTYDKQRDDLKAIEKAIQQEKIWMKQRIDFAQIYNEPFDSKLMLSSTECLNQLIKYANGNQPDLVILAGDIIDYYSRSNYDFLVKSIRKLKSPYLFSCGNHESPSENFLDICQGDCDFQFVDLTEFLVVSLNNSNRKISQYQFESFQKILSMKKPIILVMHVPILTEYNQTEFPKLEAYFSIKYDDCDEITLNFIELVSSSAEVKALLCGHTHGSITSRFAPKIVQYCCSSGLIGFVNKITVG
ncbi:MAG: metallophosphoesterase [Bacilli bacterium]|nr:metallophosphoesterase [Bacilli bacterium]